MAIDITNSLRIAVAQTIWPCPNHGMAFSMEFVEAFRPESLMGENHKGNVGERCQRIHGRETTKPLGVTEVIVDVVTDEPGH